MIGNSRKKIDQLKKELTNEFEMKDMGSPEKFLWIEIIRHHNTNTMYLHQERFTEKLLEKFHMENCNQVRIPMITSEAE
ncbi:hypothetical protein PGB90_003969 [Kerria lacca]